MYSEFGKYDVYNECGSIYCYKDSNVLRNKYGIRDYQKLRKLEQDIVGAKQHYLLSNPIRGRFTANHLCNIHRFLFENIYSFAGRYRLEAIQKGDTRFESENNIPNKLHKLLDELKRENYLMGLPYDEFINRLAYYLAELNYIHPFREGNGRATREFMRLLIAKNGYDVNWTVAGVEALMDAMVLSVFEREPLQDVLRVCIKRIEQE